MKNTYSELLKDPRWQKKRLEILSRDKWSCRECGEKTKTLHVHHILYISGLNPWEYQPDFLLTLCHECHEEADSGPAKSFICALIQRGLKSSDFVKILQAI